MGRVHRIHEQTIELRARDEGLAHGLLDRVSALQRRELVAILDRVCTEASPHSGPTHRLERLELELGAIDPERFEVEFRRAFETALRRALAKAIAEVEDEDPAIADARAPGSLLELVEVFATTGALPWWADGHRGDLIDRAVDVLVRRASTPLRELVLRLGARPETLARVVLALDEPTRAALLEHMLPDAGARLVRQLTRPDGPLASADASARTELWIAALVSASVALRDARVSSVNERFVVALLERVPTRIPTWTRAELAHVLGLDLARDNDSDSSAAPDSFTRDREAEDIHAARGRARVEPSAASLERTPHDRRADTSESTHADPHTPLAPRPPKLHPSTDTIPIGDAGLVLLWPFIPHLLRHCELTVDDAFIDARARTQAVALLEYCARGRVELVEWQLVLEKILCGLAPDDVLAPLDPNQPLAPELLAEADRMLEAVVVHAEILRDMPIDSLRATFLRREGLLRVRDGAWLVQVEAMTHDIVLERLPWGFAWVTLPWMPDPIHVEW